MKYTLEEKNINYQPCTIECVRCKTTKNDNFIYGMLRNTFYCSNCWNDIHFINNAIDEKFINLEKKVEDLILGAVDKNKKIKNIDSDNKLRDENIKLLDEKINNLNELLETIIKKFNEIENI